MNSLFDEPAVATVDPASVSLGTLLQVADLEAVTGLIRVGVVGEIHLRSGLPTDARCDHLTGLDAFYELFIEAPSAGLLSIVRADAHAEVWGRRPLASLILEGTRRADEWSRVWRQVVRLRDGADAAPADEAHAAFRQALQRELPVAEAVASAGLARHVAACLVAQWLDQGLAVGITTVATPPAPRGQVGTRAAARPSPAADEAPVGPAADAFFDQLDLGRRALRAGDLTAALLAFQAATAVRPDDRVARQNLRRVESLMAVSS